MTKMKQLLVVMVLLCVALTGCEKGPQTLDEKAGGFSYDLPAGWTISDLGGVKYKVARWQAVHGFAPNIVVVDEEFRGKLAEYVDLNVQNLDKVLTGVKVLKREKVTTSAGQAGVRVVIVNEQGGRQLRQTFYFYENGSRKYVVTCTAPAENGESLDAMFEEIMNTFRLQ